MFLRKALQARGTLANDRCAAAPTQQVFFATRPEDMPDFQGCPGLAERAGGVLDL
jgi:hypothetical protein